MYPSLKLNILAACLFVSSVASVANAQLASDQSFKNIYNNKKISEKLAEKNQTPASFKPMQKEQNLPGSRASLKDLAKLTIKKPGRISGLGSAESDQDKKNKLPSNSPALKQMGFRAVKTPKSRLH